jgi:hypothetical protein
MEVSKFSLHISSNTGTKAANITGQILGSLKEFCLPCTFGLGFRVLGFMQTMHDMLHLSGLTSMLHNPLLLILEKCT